MRECGRCGDTSTLDGDFCQACGAYLDWHGYSRADDPGVGSSRPPARGSTTAPSQPSDVTESRIVVPGPRGQRSGVAVALHSPRVQVRPGESAEVEVAVRNLGTVVDEIAVRVDGAPHGWSRVAPSSVAVYPGDAATVTLTFSPPRDAELPAGETPYRVDARSMVHDGTHAVHDGVVELAEVTRLELEVTPVRQHATESADFHVAVHNRGNHRATAALAPGAGQHLLQVSYHPERLALAAFGTGHVAVRVEAPEKKPSESRPYPLRFEAVVKDGEDRGVSASAEAVFVHEPTPPPGWYVASLLGWLGGGLLAALLLAGVAVGGLVLLDGFGAEELLSVLPAVSATGGVIVCVGMVVGVRRALRSRGATRTGLTCALVAAFTLLWFGAVNLAASGAGAAWVLVVLASPPVLARWVALRGLPGPPPDHATVSKAPSAAPGAPGTAPGPSGPDPQPARPRPATEVTRPAVPVIEALTDRAGGRAAVVDTAQVCRSCATPNSPDRDVCLSCGARLRDRRPETAAEHDRERAVGPARRNLGLRPRRHIALVVALVGALALYVLVGLPASIIPPGANLRSGPGLEHQVIDVLGGGSAVTVRCVVDVFWVAVTYPQPGYVSADLVDHLPARPCLG